MIDLLLGHLPVLGKYLIHPLTVVVNFVVDGVQCVLINCF